MMGLRGRGDQMDFRERGRSADRPAPAVCKARRTLPRVTEATEAAHPPRPAIPPFIILAD